MIASEWTCETLGPVLNKHSLGFGILYIDVCDRNLFRRRWAAHVFYGYTPSYSDTTAHPYLSSGPQLAVYTGHKNRGVMRAYEKHTPTTPEPGRSAYRIGLLPPVVIGCWVGDCWGPQ